MKNLKPNRYGSRMYHQIEVYKNPSFYHIVSYLLSKMVGVKIHLPIYIAEDAPQIIEIEVGIEKAINVLIQNWVKDNEKPIVLIRTKNNKKTQLCYETLSVLQEWAEKVENAE